MRLFPFAPMTTFFGHVLHIVSMSSGEKMLGITAFWIVALMARLQAFAQRPVVQFVGKAMSVYPSFWAVKLHDAIAAVLGIARPLPTIVWATLIDTLPKVFLAGGGVIVWAKSFSGRRAMSGDVVEWLSLHPTASRSVDFGNCSFLSTTTVTITIGDFLRGIIAHVDTLLSEFGLIRRRVDARWPVLLLLFIGVIIPQQYMFGGYVRVPR